MNYWILLCISGVVLMCGSFAYSAIRWRRAPQAFRAMNYVAIASLMAGILLTLSLAHWVEPLVSASSEGRAHTSWNHAKAAPESPRISATGKHAPARTSAGGIPFYAVYGARQPYGVPSSCKGATPFETWKSFDEGCMLGNHSPASLCCRVAHLFEHGGVQDRLISSREVAAFCGAGLLSKDSEVCKAALRLAGSGH